MEGDDLIDRDEADVECAGRCGDEEISRVTDDL